MTATPQIIFIKPDWQPMETAPKDGSVIRLAIECAQSWIDETLLFHKDVFWGKMTGSPNDGNVWVDTNAPENGLVSESEFIRQCSHHDHSPEASHYYRGKRIIGWTRPWDIIIEYPKVAKPLYVDEVYDYRKKG